MGGSVNSGNIKDDSNWEKYKRYALFFQLHDKPAFFF